MIFTTNHTWSLTFRDSDKFLKTGFLLQAQLVVEKSILTVAIL